MPAVLGACLSFRDVSISRWDPGLPEAFPELSTPIWTDMVVAQVIFLTCQVVSVTCTYLKRRPWHGNPPLLEQESCAHTETHLLLNLFHALHPLPMCHSELSGESFFNIFPRALFSFPIQSHSSELGKTFPFRVSQNCNSGSDPWTLRMKGSQILEKFRKKK